MGRWYQSSDAHFVDDKMMELPWQLMGQVIEKKDNLVKDTINKGYSLYDKLQAQGLDQDNPRLKQIIGDYQNQIENYVTEIKKNPMGYQKFGESFRKLGRDINNDWTRGEVAAIEGNRKAYLDMLKNNEELAKKDPEKYTQDYINLINKKSLEDYTGAGYNRDTGNYNSFKATDALGLDNLNEWVDKRLKDAIPDASSVEYDQPSGRWIVTTKNSTKALTDNEINGILNNAFQADTALQKALEQRSQLEMPEFSSVLDKDGQFRTDSNSLLGSAFESGRKKFGFVQEEKARTLKKDDYAYKEFEYNFDKKKELEETEYAVENVSTYLTNPNGNSLAEYSQFRKGIMEGIDSTKTRAIEVAMKEKGVKSIAEFTRKYPSLVTQIYQGNLSVAGKSPILKSLQTEYNEHKFALSQQEALNDEFKARTGYSYKDIFKLPPAQRAAAEKAWNAFATSDGRGGTVEVIRKKTWEGTGVTEKQREAITKQIANSGSYKNFALSFPPGTVYKNAEGESIDLGAKEYTFNDMVRLKLISPKSLQNPVMVNKNKDRKKDNGEPMEPSYEIQYTLVDGTTPLNFNVTPESIAPIIGINDSGNIDLGMNISLGGKAAHARVDEITTSSIEGFKRKNNNTLRAQRTFAKWNGLENVKLPVKGLKDATYHGRDVVKNGKVIYHAGTITVPTGKKNAKGEPTYEVFDVNQENVAKAFGELMFGN